MRKILFITGTRADFGKLKPLIDAVDHLDNIDCMLFVTGMHMMERYGGTYREVINARMKNRPRSQAVMSTTHMFMNQVPGDTQDMIIANTIQGLSRYVTENRPDMVVVHGDRAEALAAAIVGSMQNIRVGHIEGGEVSGTVDELIRHAVSKLSHLHFVANETCRERLVRMGETTDSIYTIGSPDLDSLRSPNLPPLEAAKARYDITFNDYAIALFHPVTTELEEYRKYAKWFVDALIASKHNYVVILPNNDPGSEHIFHEYRRLKGDSHFRVFPSIRFEFFLSLMKSAGLMVGNSSAGIREMPFCGKPTVNVGSRQMNRTLSPSVINTGYEQESIMAGLIEAGKMKELQPSEEFGAGNSTKLFLQVIQEESLWQTPLQKRFND
ncbi:MAG: UDP-N-acetylglucosamine 2-epimerase [Candidatus Sedimenticola sp. (ex Thyasira tokunagai)]